MIREIDSTLPSFRRQVFRPGLNVLLAERLAGSGETETRNGAGKSSLVEIIHFLLGSQPGKESVIRAQALSGVEFRGSFEFSGASFFVRRRAGPDAGKIRVESGHPGGDLVSWERDEAGPYISVDGWRAWLGSAVFKRPQSVGRDLPSFRAMFGYFARRREDGGFRSPFRANSNTSEGESMFALSYLLGLDPKIMREFEDVRIKKRDEDAAKRVNSEGGSQKERVARIRAHMLRADDERAEALKMVQGFKVLPHYEELSAAASEEKRALDRLGIEAAEATSQLTGLKDAAREDVDVREGDLEALFVTAGVQLPGAVRRTFEEVASFHRSVIANRKRYLSGQIAALERKLEGIRNEAEERGARRTALLVQMASGGAFSDLASRQRRLALAENEVERLQTRLKEAEEEARSKSAYSVARESLRDRLERDLMERAPAVNAAVREVGRVLKALYGDRETALEIMASKSGLDLRISIDGDRSGGISQMEIFAFDLALFTLVSRRYGGPGFLIHDSHLFGDVDARQITTALVLGSHAADEAGGQYIVTMNSDVFAGLSFPSDFPIASKILPGMLDDTETGGLFGMRI